VGLYRVALVFDGTGGAGCHKGFSNVINRILALDIRENAQLKFLASGPVQFYSGTVGWIVQQINNLRTFLPPTASAAHQNKEPSIFGYGEP
jgi:hypothetical protein